MFSGHWHAEVWLSFVIFAFVWSTDDSALLCAQRAGPHWQQWSAYFQACKNQHQVPLRYSDINCRNHFWCKKLYNPVKSCTNNPIHNCIRNDFNQAKLNLVSFCYMKIHVRQWVWRLCHSIFINIIKLQNMSLKYSWPKLILIFESCFNF